MVTSVPNDTRFYRPESGIGSSGIDSRCYKQGLGSGSDRGRIDTRFQMMGSAGIVDRIDSSYSKVMGGDLFPHSNKDFNKQMGCLEQLASEHAQHEILPKSKTKSSSYVLSLRSLSPLAYFSLLFRKVLLEWQRPTQDFLLYNRTIYVIEDL